MFRNVKITLIVIACKKPFIIGTQTNIKISAQNAYDIIATE